MKSTHALCTFLLGSTLLAATSTLHAADGTWNIDTTNGLWGTDTNWVSNTIADLSGFTANFTNDITGDRAVRLDGDRTLTNVIFGDSDTATAGSWLLDNNGLGTNNLILAGTTPGITVNALGTGKTATISAIIQGTAGLVKSGNGTLVLSGANTYTGNLTVDGGTLIGTVAGAFGSFSGARTINVNTGGILDFRANATGHNSTNMNLVINGGTVTNAVTNTFNGLNNVTLSGGTLTSTSGIAGGPHDWGAWHINGTVTSTGTSLIEGAATSGRHIRLNANADNTNFDVQSDTLTVSAPIKNGRQPSGAFTERTSTLTKLGAGTMTLSATNLYTGATTVSTGTLALGKSDVLPNSTAVSLGTAILAVGAGFTDTAGILNVTGSAAINLGDAVSKIAFADNGALLTWAGTLNITGTFVPGASVRFGTDASGLTTDQLNLITVNGSGTYTLDPTGYLIASSASGFDSWKTVNGAGLQTLSDDHDNDGVSNGIEYFLGGPAGDTTGFTPLPALIPAGPTSSITWIKGPGYIGTYGTHFQVETSATLDNPWILETVGVNVTDTPTSVTFTFPAGTKNFARLKVTGP